MYWIYLGPVSYTHLDVYKRQDVNRVQPEYPRAAMMRKNADMMMEAAASAPMAEESLLEYHLYTLDRPTTIAESQTKQVALLSASNIPARKELVLKGAEYYYTCLLYTSRCV